jgi:hypothetical protein
MEIEALVNYFIANEGPWAVLFVILLVWTTRTNNKREQRMSDQHREDRAQTIGQLQEIQKDTALILETWKLIIERELERREKP